MKQLIFLILASLTSYSLASDLDITRKTFLLSLGLGGGSTEYEFTAKGYGSYNFDYDSGEQDLGSAATIKFKIGGHLGKNNQHALYYVTHQDLFDIEESQITAGLAGIGYTYFLKPSSRSMFFEVNTGLGLISENEKLSMIGSGAVLAVGYEFAKNFQASAFCSVIAGLDEQVGTNYYYESQLEFTTFGVMIEAKL